MSGTREARSRGGADGAPDTRPRPRAVLVGVQLPGVDAVQHTASLAELGRLVDTLGADVIGTIDQRRNGLHTGVVLGEGKLRTLATWTGGSGVAPQGPPRRVVTKARARWEDAEDAAFEDDALPEPAPADDDAWTSVTGGGEDDLFEDDAPTDARPENVAPATLVVVDHDLSPSQLRNLERACGCEVMDRTGVIVEIFSRHARSREARLQVEIARLNYLAPRLRETGGGDRQRGGIGGKGAGESALELDRRKIRDRVAQLRQELASIEHEAVTRRARRAESLRVALVGYTNAGKSSLMRALTGSEVYVADRLFATLDTTVRALHPVTVPRILVSDTVGFIKKLPHDLVASFRSTLDEALEASLLLHVVDSSDPTFQEQYDVTRSVLDEIGAQDVPARLVLNKADRLDAATRAALAEEYPNAWFTSAVTPEAVSELRAQIVAHFAAGMVEEEVFLGWSATHLIGELRSRVTVLSESWENEGVRYQIRGPAADVAWVRGKLEA